MGWGGGGGVVYGCGLVATAAGFFNAKYLLLFCNFSDVHARIPQPVVQGGDAIGELKFSYHVVQTRYFITSKAHLKITPTPLPCLSFSPIIFQSIQ